MDAGYRQNVADTGMSERFCDIESAVVDVFDYAAGS